ncbi:MAG: hypothetical protein K1X29_10330 [Bdellovibrionales bacterium]|nr:hypothetical protein [Bdellovibrionales bacterium]
MSCELLMSNQVSASSRVDFKEFIQYILGLVPMSSFCKARIWKTQNVYRAVVFIKFMDHSFLSRRESRSLALLIRSLRFELMKQIKIWRLGRFSPKVSDVAIECENRLAHGGVLCAQ